MNQESIFALRSIAAGGPGSGCHGPNCGRPEGTHKLEEKDIVRLKFPETLYNTKTGNNDPFPAGKLKGVIVNVLPKVGSEEQRVKINILPPKKKYEADLFKYVKVSQIELHKPGNTEQVGELKPVKKSEVIKKFKTDDGATVTWIKPHVEGEKEPKSLATISKEKHYKYGDFGLIARVKGIQDRPGYKRVTRLYDTTGKPVYFQKGSNTTIWVDSYTRKGKIKEVNIVEQNTTTYGQKTRGALTFSYTNAANAVGMLKTRYGIKTTLARLRN